jgi:tetratricopeptide (TPR) repeat protein
MKIVMTRNLKSALKEIKDGNLKNALQLLNKIISKDVNNYDAYLTRGRVKRELKDYQGALKDYDRLSVFYPDKAEVYNNRAKLHYLMCGYKYALQDIIYANVLYPDCALILFNKGKIEYRLHLYKEAIESFSSGIKSDPTVLSAYFKRGILNEKTGNYQGALSDYTFVIKHNKNCLNAYYRRGNLLINCLNDEINGKKDLSLVSKLVPENTEIQNNVPNNYQRVNSV